MEDGGSTVGVLQIWVFQVFGQGVPEHPGLLQVMKRGISSGSGPKAPTPKP